MCFLTFKSCNLKKRNKWHIRSFCCPYVYVRFLGSRVSFHLFLRCVCVCLLQLSCTGCICISDPVFLRQDGLQVHINSYFEDKAAVHTTFRGGIFLSRWKSDAFDVFLYLTIMHYAFNVITCVLCHIITGKRQKTYERSLHTGLCDETSQSTLRLNLQNCLALICLSGEHKQR